MKNRVKISIDGKSFTLVGEESEEHIRSVAAYIDEKMTESVKRPLLLRWIPALLMC